MPNYKDKTFCTAHCINENCPRRLTQEIKKGAEQFGLPLSLLDFSSDCDVYQPVYMRGNKNES